MDALTARRAHDGDIGFLKTLIGSEVEAMQERYGEYKLSHLVENSYICITMTEAAGRIVAFAAFSDAPPSTYTPEFNDWARRFPSMVDYTPATSLWLSFYVADPLFEVDAMTLALNTAFQTIPTANQCLYQLPKDTTPFLPVRDAFVIEGSTIDDTHMGNKFNGDQLCVASRMYYVPDLLIRPARVEDHDDLAPIFNSQSEVLAEDYGEFFLADVIASQDEDHRAIVGEAQGGRAVGLLGITRDVELGVLQQCFELNPYNNLVKVKAKEVKASESKEAEGDVSADWLKLTAGNMDVIQESFNKLAASSVKEEEKKEDEGEGKAEEEELQVSALEFAAYLSDQGEIWEYCEAVGEESKTGEPAEVLKDLGLKIMQEWEMEGSAMVTWSSFAKWIKEMEEVREEEECFSAFTSWYSDTKGVRALLKEIFDGVAVEDAVTLEEYRVAVEGLTKDNIYPGRKSLVDDMYTVLELSTLLCPREEEEAKEGGEEGKEEAKTDSAEKGDPSDLVLTSSAFAKALDKIESRLKVGRLVARGLRIVLVGTPGAGKYTQAERLAERYQIPHVSTLKLLQEAASSDLEESKVISSLLENGDNVPDDIATAIVGNELSTVGDSWVLSGYCLTDNQANHLVDYAPTHVFILQTDEVTALERCAGRVKDTQTGKMYHKTLLPPPKEEEEGKEEEGRWEDKKDLTADVVSKAFEDLVDYRSTGLGSCTDCIENINAQQTVHNITEDVIYMVEEGEGAEDLDGNELDDDVIDDLVDGDAGVEGGVIKGEINAFAIDLFCLDEAHESRAVDFLHEAFDIYPEREYCIITLPHQSMENSLLSLFTQVPSKQLGTFSHVLYIVHKSMLLGLQDMYLEVASPKDMATIGQLVAGMGQAEDIQNTFKRCVDAPNLEEAKVPEEASEREEIAFVFKIDNQIIGGAVLNTFHTSMDGVMAIKAAYCLDEFVDFSQHRAKKQATMTHFFINPIFVRCARFAIKECLRLYGKTLVYFRQGRGDAIPPVILREFCPVRARRVPSNSAKMREEEEEDKKLLEPNIALYFIAMRLLAEPKIIKNDRIVVVGASDCAMALIETLTMAPYMQFSHITLISPEGIPEAMGPAPFIPVSCDGIPIGGARDISMAAQIKVVKSHLSFLDREACCVILPDDALVPYDTLVIATGLQDATSRELGYTDPTEYPEGLYFLTDNKAASDVDDFVYNSFAKTADDVVIYGSSLTCLSSIHALVERGIEGERIVWIQPHDELTDLVNDDVVRTRILDALTESGVTVKQGYSMLRIDTARGCVTGVDVEKLDPAGDRLDSATLPCGLIICANTPDVNADIFATVNDCGLVYDGRLVVNHNFRTSDPQIYAAGSVTKYSRKYRTNLPLEVYDSREIGVSLGSYLLSLLDPMSPATVEDDDESAGNALETDSFIQARGQLPKFILPKATSATVVGGLEYFHASLAEVLEPTRVLITDPEGRSKYCKLTLDKLERIAALTYIGTESIPCANLKQLIGMPVELLNGIDAGFSNGDVTDILAFLEENWAQAFYHDKFRSFLINLKESMKDDSGVLDVISAMQEGMDNGEDAKDLLFRRREVLGIGGSSLPPSTKKAIENKLLHLLRDNRLMLPQYYLPGSAVSV